MEPRAWSGTALLDSSSCGERVASFRFAKPPGYAFAPGQYALLRLRTAEGPQSKPFTLSQAPADPYLEVTTRLSGSPFKRALASMAAGDPAEVSGARGSTVLPEGTRRVAFLVGGVGVTPARSILRDAASRGGGGLDAVLLYGNVDDVCVPFLEELEGMAGEGWCRLVLAYERPPSGWAGESGFITAAMVRRHVRMDDGLRFVVAGPPAMADAMTAVLDELAVPEDRRLVERFSGY
ncbi:MAG: FAD-dependent oxidoreductase [Coriobacteriia bacterium]|nr:FAD-dependent oxidoreductase [Coriobacteriia bacterium]